MEHGTGAAREVRKHITKLFNWSVDQGLLAASPVAGMRRPELGCTTRERLLSMVELRAVWAAAGKMGYPFGPMAWLPILTAQRRAEVANLERGWLLPDQQAFEVPASHYKTDRPQVVPLSAPALAVVENLPKWNSGDFMLSTTAGKRPVSGFSKAKARLDRLSGVEGWTLHDLRRSAATHMARLGVAQEHIERVLGHAIEGVAGTYNRYSYLPEKRAALANFVKVVETEEGTKDKPVGPPVSLSLAYIQRVREGGGWLPVLRSIVECPMLRADGTVLAQEGYDAASGLILDTSGATFDAVPDAPSREDAVAALAKLKRIIKGFPFVEDEAGRSPSRSVALSERGVPLLMPQDIMGMPDDRQLLFVKSAPPVLAEKVPYWNASPWSDWADPNPMEGDHPRGGKPVFRLGYSIKGSKP